MRFYESAKQGAVSGLKTGAIAAGTMAVVDARKGGYNLWSGEYTEQSLRRRFKGIPKDFTFTKSRKNDGFRFTDPNNPNNRVRIMQGKEGTFQQNPYYEAQKNGIRYDVNGFELNKNLMPPEQYRIKTHIPFENYKPINLPKWND